MSVPPTMRAVVLTGHGGLDRLVRLIERGRLRAQLAQTYPLAALARAQRDILARRRVGKLVVVPRTDT